MDPFNLTSGVITVIQIADRIIGLCREYLDAIKDAPRDLRLILVEVATLKDLFEPIKHLLEASTIQQQESSLVTPVDVCYKALKELKVVIRANQPRANNPQKRQKVSLATLAWPFKQTKALKLIAEIETYKNTINLVLTADISIDLKAVQEIVLWWLVSVDSSTNHSDTYLLHEKNISQWVDKTFEWRNWLQGQQRLLWIHGIPGASKTVLTSFLIERLREICSKSSGKLRTGLAYHYCYHARSHQDEVLPFLCSIISQLCRELKTVPRIIREAYEGNFIPTPRSLLKLLANMAREFSTIFIVIDKHVSILVTSRNERDTQETLQRYDSSLSMSNPFLHSDAKFMHWPDSLLRDIKNALTKGAKGIALNELSKTLDEIYERILYNIPKASRQLTYRAFALLCTQSSDIVLMTNMLAEAVLINE
ncbi:hypothetical protein QBC46DRAFT_421476 [Diplogelasinospora grovesii]|uniref:NACHT domain-containing protein n=1 Tax=Diplogelasinospora grovesii TaxID=303347 RepID=A0AAN6S6R6_9PEZI|nr:hypothetical protein QBC46DRAFT_421476 [Diplogelasinospora grovesii]